MANNIMCMGRPTAHVESIKVDTLTHWPRDTMMTAGSTLLTTPIVKFHTKPQFDTKITILPQFALLLKKYGTLLILTELLDFVQFS